MYVLVLVAAVAEDIDAFGQGRNIEHGMAVRQLVLANRPAGNVGDIEHAVCGCGGYVDGYLAAAGGIGVYAQAAIAQGIGHGKGCGGECMLCDCIGIGAADGAEVNVIEGVGLQTAYVYGGIGSDGAG